MAKSVRSNSVQSIYGWDDKAKGAQAAADDILAFHSVKFNRTKVADDLSNKDDASVTQADGFGSSGDDDGDEGSEDARAPEGVEGGQ